MADNTTLPIPSGSTSGDIVRDIDRAGVKTQVVQLDHGGTAGESLTGAANPLPAKISDGTNTVGVGSSSSVGNETTLDRLKVNSALRLLDTAQAVGSQLVAAKGDQTTGLWVNVKNANLSVTGTFFQATQPVSLGSTTLTGTSAVSLATLPALTAGAAVIGAVTQSGTWNIGTVTTLPALVAGAALIGKVGIDQTTPGTTNLVSIGTSGTVSLTAPPVTYSASINGLVPAALATDVFTITGSATKTVRISKIIINGVQTTAGQVAILLIKRTAADTVGTSTAPTRTPYDSASAAATATVLAYTANPTTAGSAFTVTANRLFVPGVASASDAQGLMIIAGDVGQQYITLRGIAEVIAVNLGGVTITGGAINVTVEWMES